MVSFYFLKMPWGQAAAGVYKPYKENVNDDKAYFGIT